MSQPIDPNKYLIRYPPDPEPGENRCPQCGRGTTTHLFRGRARFDRHYGSRNFDPCPGSWTFTSGETHEAS